MDNIKLDIIEGNLGDTVFKYNKYLKLSNGYFLIRDNRCLQLCELKNLKFKTISSSPKFIWTALGILELNDKNIMVSGRNFLKILKIENNKFQIIKEFDVYDYGELLDIYQLENGKIIVNSIIGILILIEKRGNQYEITKKIKIERRNHSIECIGDNKIILIERFYDYSDIRKTKLITSIISILDFSEENIDRKIINSKYKIEGCTFWIKSIFNLNNGILLFISGTKIFIFNLNFKEIISIYEMKSLLIDIISYKDDDYLCIFNDYTVALASFKNEFIIKQIKEYDRKKLLPLRFITMNEKIYLYCDIVKKA